MSEQEKQKKDKQPRPPGDKHGHGPKPEGAHKGGGGEKAKRKPKGEAAPQETADDGPQQPAPPARLIAAYRDQIVPALVQRFGYKNKLSVPRLEKVVISMGLGKFSTDSANKGKFEQAEKELGVIAGQKPVRCKAKKSVANFKVREGMDTGLKVTLRGSRMYEFVDRLVALAIPRVKDFRGLNPNGFDKSGNYNFGFTEQTVFPEVDTSAVTFQQGMNITVVTTAGSVEEGRELLKAFGIPFRVDEKVAAAAEKAAAEKATAEKPAAATAAK
jgi:large subunit ribosomal protein L5